jgi:hypothetical protein
MNERHGEKGRYGLIPALVGTDTTGVDAHHKAGPARPTELPDAISLQAIKVETFRFLLSLHIFFA